MGLGLGSLVGSSSRAALHISATPMRSDSRQWLLVRARKADAASSAAADDTTAFANFVERTPDAVVITDSRGRVQMANPAFHTLCGVSGEAAVRGRHIGEVMGDTQHQWADLLAKARTRGVVGRARR